HHHHHHSQDPNALIDRLGIQLKDNLVFSLGVESDKIKDLSGNNTNLEVKTGVQIVDGRDSKTIRLNSNENSSIIVQKNESINFSYFSDFTISFWIRVPRLNKNDFIDLGIEYDLVNNMDNQGWKISLKDGNLVWRMKDRFGKIIDIITSLTFSNSFIDKYISSNIWRHITITVNQLKDCTLYINGDKIDSKSINELRGIDNNSPIIFKLEGNRNKNQFIRLDQFNIYQRALNESEVEMLFNSYFNSNILRDFWGEPLEYNKSYYMINQAILGGPLRSTYKSWYGEYYPYISRMRTFNVSSFILIPYLYHKGSDVEKVKIINKNNVDKYVRKNDVADVKFENYGNLILTLPMYSKIKERYMVLNEGRNGDLKLIQLQSNDKYYCQIRIFEMYRNGLLSIADDENWLYSSGWYLYSSGWYLDNYKTLDLKKHTKTNWYFVSEDEGWKE
uniref:Binding domain (Hc) of Paraclostridial Mosquitocidal Protein 1 n=1 Tax=Paraclostridium bifermentans TaxID=1490 RepID=UPI00114D3E6D|nr:Chain A, Binding domain (Hc) of Paraclostridial Mosquitocidal Protein 1 [Paraclostridium bifermentans]